MIAGDPGTDPTTSLGADETLAMDLALGGLSRTERRAAEMRLRSDPGFRALAEAWQAMLAPLDAATPPLVPASMVWDAIAIEISPPAPRRAAVIPAARIGWWNNLALWRGLALTGSAAAVVAFSNLALPPAALPGAPAALPGAPPQLLVAALAAADGTPLLAASYDPLRGNVVLTPATQRRDNGKSPELWVIEGNKPPRSLGIIDIRGPSAVVIPPQKLQGLAAGSTLAISIEPLGGSPTGQPTGPVVATGTLTAV